MNTDDTKLLLGGEEREMEFPATCSRPLFNEMNDESNDIHLYNRVQVVDVGFRLHLEVSGNGPKHLVVWSTEHSKDKMRFLESLTDLHDLSKEDCWSILEGDSREIPIQNNEGIDVSQTNLHQATLTIQQHYIELGQKRKELRLADERARSYVKVTEGGQILAPILLILGAI